MAQQIGYGYGSEFQLMRFLGHHRDHLESEISKFINETGQFHWFDFDFASPKNSISGDQELLALSFLDPNNEKHKAALDDYHSYDINDIDKWQNWDAVFSLNGTIYLVEAKAYAKEIGDDKTHGGKSGSVILQFFKDKLPHLPVNDSWLKKYYQLANRLAIASLLNQHGIPCKVLYIYFVNGYNTRIVASRKVREIPSKNQNTSKEQFQEAIKQEMEALELNEEMVKDLLAPAVYIDAEKKNSLF